MGYWRCLTSPRISQGPCWTALILKLKHWPGIWEVPLCWKFLTLHLCLWLWALGMKKEPPFLLRSVLLWFQKGLTKTTLWILVRKSFKLMIHGSNKSGTKSNTKRSRLFPKLRCNNIPFPKMNRGQAVMRLQRFFREKRARQLHHRKLDVPWLRTCTYPANQFQVTNGHWLQIQTTIQALVESGECSYCYTWWTATYHCQWEGSWAWCTCCDYNGTVPKLDKTILPTTGDFGNCGQHEEPCTYQGLVDSTGTAGDQKQSERCPGQYGRYHYDLHQSLGWVVGYFDMEWDYTLPGQSYPQMLMGRIQGLCCGSLL